MSSGKSRSLREAEMREATGLDPAWQVIWVGADRVMHREHLCAGPRGPAGLSRSEWVRVRYAPTGTPGIQVAKCERCRMAWVRRVGG